MQVVWFKRDLRINDNKAFDEANKRGKVLPLYILEPELWNQPDLSYQQYQFLVECLNELDTALKNLGQRLIIKIGNAKDILQQIHNKHKINCLWSHQETWNGWTYARDISIKKWAKKNYINCLLYGENKHYKHT